MWKGEFGRWSTILGIEHFTVDGQPPAGSVDRRRVVARTSEAMEEVYEADSSSKNEQGNKGTSIELQQIIPHRVVEFGPSLSKKMLTSRSIQIPSRTIQILDDIPIDRSFVRE